MRGRTRILAVALAAALVVAGCSSGGSSGGSSTTAAGDPAGDASVDAATVAWPGPVDWEPASCDEHGDGEPEAVPVDGSDSDFDLTSFDGTRIRIHWFPNPDADGAPSPTILMGPGWGTPGDTDTTRSATPGAPEGATIPGLHDAGYNVATWDPRGFGESDGTVQIDSVDFEARDVSTLIDWVASRDGVQLDDDGDPRLGMVGGSYGGGIQFVTAATDCRVDVITPSIAWNSLATSLYPDETYKAGWAGLLLMAAASADLDDHIVSADEDASSTGVLDQADRQWFVDRGPDFLLDRIDVPTLILQGTVDNLFPLSEGVRNYVALRANDIPVAMTWFCGGHGVCDDPPAPEGYESEVLLAWLARYLQDDTDTAVVPGFRTVDQAGGVHTFASYPPAGAHTPVFAFADEGSLALQPDGGSGPMPEPDTDDVIAKVAASITPARATEAVELPVTVPDAHDLVVGPPELVLGYTCTLDDEATLPTRIFAQLVDDETGRVLGNQVTPVAVACDGLLHQTRVLLEPVAYAPSGEGALTLQLVATTVAYGVPQMGGAVDFDRIELALPVVSD